MNEYEVSIETLAIVSKGDGLTQVFEESGDFYVEEKPLTLIDNSCKYFGASLAGRQEGTKKMIGVTHKAPIIMEESTNLVFFPTHSPTHLNCSWININKLVHYKKSDDNLKTILIFSNGVTLEFDIKYGSMNNQILRSARLVNVLQSRKEKK